MTATIWKNGTRYEWIIYNGDEVVARSGLIFTSYARAMRKLILANERILNNEEA